jgi:hypothetical protein
MYLYIITTIIIIINLLTYYINNRNSGALNSDPPAMKYQNNVSQVLHLMGEITSLRSKAFGYALQSVCTSISAAVDTLQKPLSRQLGLSREYLLQLADEVYSQATSDLLHQAEDIIHSNQKETALPLFEELGR